MCPRHDIAEILLTFNQSIIL